LPLEFWIERFVSWREEEEGCLWSVPGESVQQIWLEVDELNLTSHASNSFFFGLASFVTNRFNLGCSEDFGLLFLSWSRCKSNSPCAQYVTLQIKIG
jgi:hypothetical protein